MSAQLALFDTSSRQSRALPDISALEEYAFIYNGTSAGNCSGIRFMMPVEDAMAFCEMPATSGRGRGAYWACFFTRVTTYIANALGGERTIDLSRCTDDGRFDAMIASAGLRKFDLCEIADALGPHGVTVIGAPIHSRTPSRALPCPITREAA